MSPHVESLFDGNDTLIGRGVYVGVVKATRRPVCAAFAHFWLFDGLRFSGVYQITDSGSWRDVLEA